MDDISNNRFFRIFHELQAEGLIAEKRRLRECPTTLNVQGFMRSIRYRKAFYDEKLSRLSDDALRFILLHEEGHIKKGSLTPYGIIALPLLLLIVLTKSPFATLPDAGLTAMEGLLGQVPTKALIISAALAVMLLIYRIFYRRMYDEEFTADRYAAEIMKTQYNIHEPSLLLLGILTDIAARRGTRQGPGRIVTTLHPPSCRQFSGYFPPVEERVRRIRMDVDGQK